MGAAGLSSSSIEMASKGNLGIELNLDKIPCREEKMTPYEIMLSESQERMLLILKSGKEDGAKKIFKKWNLDFSIIGRTTNTKHLILNYLNNEVANLPITSLSTNAPVYDRKWKKGIIQKKVIPSKSYNSLNILDSLKKILRSPNNSGKSWIWEQYDHTVMGDTLQKPGGDSAVIRIHGKNKAVAVTVDSSSHYCLANPIDGAKQVVCESWRNLIAVGSNPIAITNCLNFGNPEKDKIMGQFVETIDGMSEACKYLDFPVVSGNVSFYNETKNKSISPTPTIGAVGLINNLDLIVNNKIKEVDSYIIVIGKTIGHLDQSEFFREIMKIYNGPPPEINLFNEKNNGLTVNELISNKLVNSVHDVSSGGILLALSEMCIYGQIGAKIKIPNNKIYPEEYFFGEDQGRYIIEVKVENKDKVTSILKKNSVYFEILGRTQKDTLDINMNLNISIHELTKLNSSWFKNYFE